MTTSEIRRAFLEYFAGKDHAVVPSAPLVPQDDPTLLFVNAGMVPFKDTFTGARERTSPRAASSQRCLRVSGKHNDLGEVGRTPRHHTLFEMLGNFSFGDYFKEDAITYAYDFLVNRLKLDPDRLMYSVFAGEDGIPADDEAAEIWKRVAGVGDDRVLRFGKSENFWAMGDTGPCGPCSEIHYDLGPELSGTVNDGDRWVEIWNLVFMQYLRDESGRLTALPAPSIDTGMGLERIASVVQGVTSNYDTDQFRGLLSRIGEIFGRPYPGDDSEEAVSMRVVADHCRATAFLLADDINPDKTGRGYVLRKVMRRAISHGVLLDVEKPFLADVCGALIDIVGDDHPLLREREDVIRRGADSEETLFRRTVQEGMRRIDDLLQQIENPEVWKQGDDGARLLAGDVAFRLYDTYGCPLELTESVGVRRGFDVDEPGYFAAMQEQRERSRASWKGAERGNLDTFFLPKKSELGATRFTGYDEVAGDSSVVALALVGDGGLEAADRAGEGSAVAIATAATPFYGESGGQIGDSGELLAEGARIRVEDTQKAAGGDLIIHFGTVEEGEIGSGTAVRLAVDAERRRNIMGHHSATHLVHHALREVLGGHVGQKGSYVGPDRLRFDFSHPQAVGPDELAAVEDRVNELVLANHDVSWRVMPYPEAIEAGALAFFGDKYGDEVRMVSMGPSRELCGGTHVSATGAVGLVTFASEGSVASGVRRVEALTGSAALKNVRALRAELAAIAESLKTNPEESMRKIDDLQNDLKRLRKKVADLEQEAAGGAAEDLESRAQEVSGHRLVAGAVPVESRDALRDLGDKLRATPQTVVVLGTEMEGKVAFVAAVSDDVVKAGRVKAGDLVGRVAKLAGGGGGGKPHLATAGAKDPSRLDEALAAVPAVLAELLN